MKRFYAQAGVSEVEYGFTVTLDGRGIKTQGGRALAVPTRALAEMLAAEWNAQGDTLDPKTFVARDMADYAIDVVKDDRHALEEKLLGYAGTDTLSYRADPDEPLWRRQQEIWEPVLTALEAREGVELPRVSGVIARPVSQESLAALRSKLETFDAFQFAALDTLTSLAASLAIGLSALEPDADLDALWDAANLEEDWQAEQWGADEEATARRAARTAQFQAAKRFADAARV